VQHRFPGIGEIRLERGWSGLREMSPDGHALLGPVKEVPGLWVAAGFSGHGFMQAPAAGEVMAGWLLHGDPGIDTTHLVPDRFGSDQDVETENVAF
jgi:sarcosine oxidase subunit beta